MSTQFKLASFKKISAVAAFVVCCNLIVGIGYFSTHSSKPQVLGVVSGKDGYQLRYSKTTNGALTFTGNSLCLSDGQPQGTCGTFVTTDENSSDAPYEVGTTSDWTKNSSTASLKLPAESQILYAELIWGGSYKYKALDLTNKLDQAVSLITPKGDYKIKPDNITSAQVSESSAYVRTANVTDIIGSDGAGTYTLGGVPATMDRNNPYNNYAGWTLAIAYRDLKQPPRNLSIFVGSEQAGPDQLSNVAEVKGFATPTGGNINGRLLVSAQEGDPCYSGDQMRFGQTKTELTALSGPNNQQGNFFASKINGDNGKINTSGSFGTSNQPDSSCSNAKRQGWDITNVDISSLLKPNQTTAYAQGYSTGDVYMINALGVQIDVNAAKPEVRLQVDKTEAKIGDTLTYTMQITNTGTTNSDNSILTGQIPAQTNYIIDSLIIDGKAVASDSPTTNLGSIKPNQTINATYQVKVSAAPNTGKFIDTANLDYEYTMVTGDQPIKDTTKSNEVITLYNEKPNLPPVAVNDKTQTPQDTLVTIDVLENDSDKDGNLEPNTLNIVKNPDNGNYMIINSKVNYTPKTGFVGNDSFVYEICDTKQLCNTATVTITVNAKPVETSAPLAVNDTSLTKVNTPVLIDVLKNDSDSDGNLNPDSLIIVKEPTKGTFEKINNQIKYTPSTDFTGTDSFQYQICDTLKACSSAVVTITVNGDAVLVTPPVVTDSTIQAVDDTGKTSTNTKVTIPVLNNDKTSSAFDKTSLKVTSLPKNGTVSVNPNGNIDYVPVKNFSGSDTFKYQICNTEKICSEAQVKVEVEASTVIELPVNPKPIAVDDQAKTSSSTKVLIPALQNDSAPNDKLDTATLKITQNAANGDVIADAKTGNIIYTPKNNFKGNDSFKYQICNTKAECATATVIVSVMESLQSGTTIAIPSSTPSAEPAKTSDSIIAVSKPEVLGTQANAKPVTNTSGSVVETPVTYSLSDSKDTKIDKQGEANPTPKNSGQILGISDVRQVLVRTGGEFGLNIALPLNIALIAIIFVLNRYTDKKQAKLAQMAE